MFAFAYTVLFDWFEHFTIRKRERRLCFALVSTNRQALIYNPTIGGKDRQREKKAHEGGTPHRLSHSLQRSCSLEKLLRSTITLKKKKKERKEKKQQQQQSITSLHNMRQKG